MSAAKAELVANATPATVHSNMFFDMTAPAACLTVAYRISVPGDTHYLRALHLIPCDDRPDNSGSIARR
jgi:hypothetical protein